MFGCKEVIVQLGNLVPFQAGGASRPSFSFATIAQEIQRGERDTGLVCLERWNSVASKELQVIGGLRDLHALRWLSETGAKPYSGPDFSVNCTVVAAESEVGAFLNDRLGADRPSYGAMCQIAHLLERAGEDSRAVARLFGVSNADAARYCAVGGTSASVQRAMRDGIISFDQALALSLTKNHALQDELLAKGTTDIWELRRALAAKSVRSDWDPRFKLVGAEYLRAGGTLGDTVLAGNSNGYWVNDPALLESLAVRELESVAKSFEGKGWGWIEVRTAMGFHERAYFNAAPREPLDSAENPQIAPIKARLDAIEVEYEKLDPEVDANTDQIMLLEQEREDLRNRLDEIDGETFLVPDRLRDYAGVLITLDDRGGVEVLEGLVRPEDALSLTSFVRMEEAEAAADAAGADLATYLEALDDEALRASVASNPSIAVRVLAHTLISQVLNFGIEQRMCGFQLGESQAASLGGTTLESWSTGHVGMVIARWKAELPRSSVELFAWLMRSSDADINSLLALCTAASLRRGMDDMRLQLAQQLYTGDAGLIRTGERGRHSLTL